MFTMKNVNEQNRTYIFSDTVVTIPQVVGVGISNTTHRLDTASGDKYIVANGWRAIKLEGVTEWSF
jgi:hypothetical protein